jgi:ABC-type molybdate transport system substrate-binding protein
VQNYTIYMAAVVANSKNADAAGSFIKFLSSPPAKDAMRAKGFETR